MMCVCFTYPEHCSRVDLVYCPTGSGVLHYWIWCSALLGLVKQNLVGSGPDVSHSVWDLLQPKFNSNNVAWFFSNKKTKYFWKGRMKISFTSHQAHQLRRQMDSFIKKCTQFKKEQINWIALKINSASQPQNIFGQDSKRSSSDQAAYQLNAKAN